MLIAKVSLEINRKITDDETQSVSPDSTVLPHGLDHSAIGRNSGLADADDLHGVTNIS